MSIEIGAQTLMSRSLWGEVDFTNQNLKRFENQFRAGTGFFVVNVANVIDVANVVNVINDAFVINVINFVNLANVINVVNLPCLRGWLF